MMCRFLDAPSENAARPHATGRVRASPPDHRASPARCSCTNCHQHWRGPRDCVEHLTNRSPTGLNDKPSHPIARDRSPRPGRRDPLCQHVARLAWHNANSTSLAFGPSRPDRENPCIARTPRVAAMPTAIRRQNPLQREDAGISPIRLRSLAGPMQHPPSGRDPGVSAPIPAAAPMRFVARTPCNVGMRTRHLQRSAGGTPCNVKTRSESLSESRQRFAGALCILSQACRRPLRPESLTRTRSGDPMRQSPPPSPYPRNPARISTHGH